MSGTPPEASAAVVRQRLQSFRAVALRLELSFMLAVLLVPWVPIRTVVTGPAIVRSGGVVEIVAPQAGTFEALLVEPGAQVEPGTPVAFVANYNARIDHAAIEASWEASGRRYLASPSEPGLEAEWAAQDRALEAARARLRGQIVRAVVSGTLTETRVPTGARVDVGHVLMTQETGSQTVIVGLLPAGRQPMISEVDVAYLELSDPPNVRTKVVGLALSREGRVPTVAERAFGFAEGELVRPDGASIVADGVPQFDTYELDGHRYPFVDGMRGQLEVRGPRTPLIFAMDPGARRFFSRFGELWNE